mmetsp:Transcript_12446/g.32744  ORF Transcript_12446/g.32744 Transcript_12446/m.32744 type:complete len:297 (+) Transcript_12446:2627-3517(+)
MTLNGPSKVVKDARAFTSDRAATSNSKAQARHAEIFKPRNARAVGLGPWKILSRACEKALRPGPQATSNIFAAAATLFAGLGLLNSSVALSCLKAAKAGRAPCLMAWTLDRTMASRSLEKASARFLRVASELRPKAALMDDATDVLACSSFSRNLSSSANVIGAALMRSKISSRNCASKSLPLQMPRLFLRKPSLVIFFSSFIAGLCKSVCNIITEKARTNATSADGNTSALRAQYLAAKVSMMRSIFWASPGKRKPARKCLMATSNSRPEKSICSPYECKTLTQNPSWYVSSLPR